MVALIIALVTLALILSDLWLPLLLPALVGLLAVLLGGFTWSAVQNIPPFDDRASHLTLPPGRAGGFRRLLGHHALLLGGIALVMAGRCVYLGGSWLAGLMTALLFCLPMAALCAAIATTASLANKGGCWRVLAWCVLGIPAMVSIYLLNFEQWGPKVEQGWYEIPGTWAAVLVALALYFATWCLAVLGRMRVAAAVILGLTGALLPWLVVYGGWGARLISPTESPSLMTLPRPGPRKASEALVRKVPPPAEKPWYPAVFKLPNVLEVRGIGEGEFLQIANMRIQGPEREGYLGVGVSKHYFSPEVPSIVELPLLWAGKSGGRTLWGEEGVWEYLRSRIPAHGQFEYWSGRPAQAPDNFLVTLPVSLRVPPPPERVSFSGMGDPDPRQVEEFLKVRPWEVGLVGPLQWEAAAPIDVARGGSSRLPCGIFVQVLPPRRDIRSLTVRIYGNRPTILDPLRFGRIFGKPVPTGSPRILLVDQDGKTAIALDAMKQGFETGAHFMEYVDWTIDPSSPSPHSKEPETSLKGQLYIFLPVLREGGFGSGVLPPP